MTRGGYVPLYFQMNFYISGLPYPNQELPSIYTYAGGIHLVTHFAFEGKIPTPTVLPSNSSLEPTDGLVFSYGQVGSGGAEIPDNILAKLPNYVPSSIAPVSEPGTVLTMVAGLLVFVLRFARLRS